MSKRSKKEHRPLSQGFLRDFQSGGTVPSPVHETPPLNSGSVSALALDSLEGVGDELDSFQRRLAQCVITGWGEPSVPERSDIFWGTIDSRSGLDAIKKREHLRRIVAPTLAFCALTRGLGQEWFRDEDVRPFSSSVNEALTTAQRLLVVASGSATVFEALNKPIKPEIAITHTEYARSEDDSGLLETRQNAYSLPDRLQDYSKDTLLAYLSSLTGLRRGMDDEYSIGRTQFPVVGVLNVPQKMSVFRDAVKTVY